MKNQSLFSSLIILIILTALCWQPEPVHAQTGVSLESVEVMVMAEFERPTVIVVYEITLPEAVPLPQTLTLQIPVKAMVEVLATRDTEGNLIPLQREATLKGEWQDISFTAPSPVIYLEYNDPGLVKNDTNHRFIFKWFSTYSVDQLSVIVQQPFGASELTSEPELIGMSANEGSSAYFRGDFGPLGAGELFSLGFHFYWDSANLTSPTFNVQSAYPVDETTRGRTASPVSVVWWLVAVAGVVLALVGIFYWWFRRSMVSRQRHVVQGVGILNPEKQAVFCYECGMRSKAGDSYCRSCGAELHQAT